MLRPLIEADGPKVQQLCAAGDIGKLLRSVPSPYPDGAAAKWIAQHPRMWETRKYMVYGIAHRQNEQLYGAVQLDLELRDSRARLSCWVAQDHWDEGVATEACGLMKRVALEHLKLERLWVRYHGENKPAARVCEKMDLRHEGTLRNHMLYNDEHHDVHIWGTTRSAAGYA